MRKEKKEKERNSIELDGTLVSAKKEDYSSLAEKVLSSVSPSFLNSPKTRLKLENVNPVTNPTGTGPPGGGNPGGRGGGVVEGKNPAKLKAIGFIGEVLAFEWLKIQYKGFVDESCWKSGYRSFVFGGSEGDDTLGYDFIVPLKSRNLYFEVKATSGDNPEIILGESEIRTAQKFHADNKECFRIIFVSNVTDSKDRSLKVLPNPFSSSGRNKFRAVGSGIKFRFEFQE